MVGELIDLTMVELLRSYYPCRRKKLAAARAKAAIAGEPGMLRKPAEIVDGATRWPYREEILPAVSSSVLPRL
jgi:hypothetical protein